MNNAWKYKIGSGRMPVILMLAMSALFGGITFWLYKTNNGAVIVLGIFTGLMVVLLLLTTYRFIFYKVLIGAEGFYYQTGAGNGVYYAYNDVEKAWISSGVAQNGVQQQYCNISLYNKRVIRFSFFYSDEEAIAYLVTQGNSAVHNIRAVSAAEKEEYLIDGKAFGKTRIFFGVLILAIVAFFDAFLIRQMGLQFVILPGIAVGIAVVWLMCNSYFFFQVRIGKDGFFCRTNPFDGQYYAYNEILDCKITQRVIKSHRSGHRSRLHYYYFEFTDAKGKKRKFYFEPPIHEHEMNVLKERIEGAQDEKAGYI